MLVELDPESRAALRLLFASFPGLHGCVSAVLDGEMGAGWCDDPARPAVGRLDIDFHLLAGDAASPAALEALEGISGPCSIVTSGAGWDALLRARYGELLSDRTRVAFQPGTWSAEDLRKWAAALPRGFQMRRIGGEEVSRFADLADSLVYNFSSLDQFVSRGVGFGVEYEGRFVSGCSSFAISPKMLEFEIQTHPDFRRRGLARATAAAMIQHCLENGLEPCWDAHNEMSAALAEKLGFVDAAPYTAFELPG